eukprot:TRINITY_DN100_c0_g1_i1.p1 TRINITY_DN100_c0_g1~~TRINITY_DN100_c0_g1_i1.p1  ORF type:complete len:1112 (-),score=374.21 TRINITY_DN100_c0_g1_i1:375-3710(-)
MAEEEFQLTADFLKDVFNGDPSSNGLDALESLGGMERLCELLRTSPTAGLPEQEQLSNHAARREQFGDNITPEAKAKSFAEIYLETLNDPMLIALSVIAAISLVIGIVRTVQHGEQEWYEGVAIIAAVLIVSLVGSYNNWDKEKRFRALNKKKQNYEVKVVRGGVDMNISTFDLLVGDIVRLQSGDAIPADGFFIGGFQLEVDQSLMTGEPIAIKKIAGRDVHMVSGTQVQSGAGTMLCTAVGVRSQFGEMLAGFTEGSEETPLQQKLDRLAQLVGYVGIGAALLTFCALMAKIGVDEAVRKSTANALHRAVEVASEYIPPPHDAAPPVAGTQTPLPTPTADPLWRVKEGHLPVTDPDVVAAWNEYVDDEFPKMSAIDVVMNVVDALMIAVTVVVVAVPEGLPLAVTMSLAYSVNRMLKDNALVRKLQACETMGCATTICSDKTGTLTLNRMSVTKLWMRGATEDVTPQRTRLPTDVVQGISVNSTANILFQAPEGGGSPRPVYQGSPTEGALLLLVNDCHDEAYSTVRRDAAADLKMVWTFDSRKKTMNTLIAVTERLQRSTATCGAIGSAVRHRLFVKGAAEIVLAQCDAYIGTNGQRVMLDATSRTQLEEVVQSFARTGLRTLLLAYKDLTDADDVEPMIEGDPPTEGFAVSCICGIKDPLRAPVPWCIERCTSAGITVRMVTGDNRLTAEHISREAGIIPVGELREGVVMEGPEFRKLSKKRMAVLLPRLRCLARSSPTDKSLLVNSLKELCGEVVSVTGDGTNDSPALKDADVGLAMGSGTEVAKEASDIVILDDNFESIVQAVVWGRSVYTNIRRFLQFQMTVNVAALVVTFISAFSDSGPPLTALQLLWVNVIMDSFAALALATEAPTDRLLDNKPRDYKRLVTNKMAKHIFLQSLYQCLVLLGFFFALEAGAFDDALNVPIARHAEPSTIDDRADIIRGLVFNSFVWCQIFNEFNARRIDDEFNILEGITKCYPFLVIQVITVGLQMAFMFGFGRYVGVGVLDGVQWATCLIIGVLVIPLSFIGRLIPVPPDWSDDDDKNDDDHDSDEDAPRAPADQTLQREFAALREEHQRLKDFISAHHQPPDAVAVTKPVPLGAAAASRS